MSDERSYERDAVDALLAAAWEAGRDAGAEVARNRSALLGNLTGPFAENRCNEAKLIAKAIRSLTYPGEAGEA